MRPLWVAAAGVILAGSAWAQRPLIEAAPLPPLQQQWQQEKSPPVSQSPGGPTTEAVQPRPAPPVTAPATITAYPDNWVPAGAAKVLALDKVNAQAATLTIGLGQSATFGALTITAKACVVRPNNEPADAAAFLTVTNRHPDTPGFAGWILENEPSVSMMQDPIYDLRVVGCG